MMFHYNKNTLNQGCKPMYSKNVCPDSHSSFQKCSKKFSLEYITIHIYFISGDRATNTKLIPFKQYIYYNITVYGFYRRKQTIGRVNR